MQTQKIDLSIRGGKYQALAPYEIQPATATRQPFVAASRANKDARAEVVAQLEAAGFVLSSANYVSIEHAAQARICTSGSGADATIGVELFDEPNAARLLGR
jgi:hypothetical protein